MWRHLALVAGVLGGHLLLLWWLHAALAPLVTSTQPVRFQMVTSTTPTPTPTPQSAPPKRPAISQPPKLSVATVPVRPSPATGQTEKAPSLVQAPKNSAQVPNENTSTAPEPSGANAGDGPSAASAHSATASPTPPSSDADYLNNPAPRYPAISRRLGEQGKVVIRVLIDENGHPQQGDIHQSSGYARLDQAALAAVMDWRYVPGRNAGTVQAMWFNVPIQFALQ